MQPTDPLSGRQWHFAQIGNIGRIWDDYTGAGVSVAVYDDGVQADHPDLAASYDSSAEFVYDGVRYGPAPLNGQAGHGTAVAGLIAAAANNGRGGVGVAFGVDLTGVNYLDVIQTYHNPGNAADMALYRAAMRHAANFDVMSNSWGWSDQFSADQNLSDDGSYAARDTALYAEISATGRGGLGTIIVQAAGNDAQDAGGDGWNVSRHTITVSAADPTGFVADYSNWGPSILIAGPAAEVTTDLVGGGGYNRGANDGDPLPVDYTGTFNGTSAATPVVSGVVALMLEANAGLGWRDVQGILALTAGHTGSAYGSAGSGSEIGGWGFGGGSGWNGGGRAYHYSYGFGMVDAYAAVRMAEAWAAFGRAAQTSANEQEVRLDYTGFARNIPDYNQFSAVPGVVTIALTTAQVIEVESIYVTVSLTHSYADDLVISLFSPDGIEIPLMSSAPYFDLMESGFTWTFAVEALRGYSSAGTWTVQVEDFVAGDVGVLTDVQIQLFGSTATANDLFHFTDDFLALAAIDPTRARIDDTDGGTDWANFAAIAGRIVANMAANGTVTVAGALWTRFAAGAAEIENFHAGDGNDNVTGNTLVNHIIGARGNDVIKGIGGSDRLEGGAGNDNLNGGSQMDVLTGGAGNDVLTGASGHDTLTGGGGEDSFVFAANFGRDVITDFRNNIDTLRLDDTLWGGGLTVAQVLAQHASYNGAGNAILTFGSSVLTLTGILNHGILSDDIVII
ncbi:MAG: S8 family serine peptidase [Pseudomonadota bacterium]